MDEISKDLIIQASHGDMHAFSVIYKTYSKLVYNVALRIVNNKEDAQELVQEVFLTVHKKLGSFQFKSSLKTWIYRITVNCTLNYVNRAAKEKNSKVEYHDELLSKFFSKDMDNFINEEYKKQVVELLLKFLSPEQRICIVLRSIEGLSYEQMSEVLQVGPSTIRSRVKRARESLLVLGRKVIKNEL